jgi:hypothetical protein
MFFRQVLELALALVAAASIAYNLGGFALALVTAIRLGAPALAAVVGARPCWPRPPRSKPSSKRPRLSTCRARATKGLMRAEIAKPTIIPVSAGLFSSRVKISRSSCARPRFTIACVVLSFMGSSAKTHTLVVLVGIMAVTQVKRPEPLRAYAGSTTERRTAG